MLAALITSSGVVMVLCVPPDPQFTTGAERVVWDALRRSLRDDDVLLANVRFTDTKGDHEGDLIVGLADCGIVVLEVKGGSVEHNGQTWIQHGAVSKRIDPVEQAQRVKYALRNYLESDARWSARRVRFAHAVAFPFSAVDAEFAMPDCPRRIVLDRDDIAGNPAGLLWDSVEAMDVDSNAPTSHDLNDAVEILSGRMRPQRDLLAISADRESQADLLTERQSVILPALQLLNRVEIRGGAGSGKTWLAMEQVRRMSARGQRVALMCYSRGLAEFLARWVNTLKPKERPAYVGTFHQLGIDWGAPPGRDDDSRYWEEVLPQAMVSLALERTDLDERFDAIVIDEAQDFAAEWWPAVLAALTDEEEGAIFAFFDDGQRVFARGGRPPIPLVPILLEENVRNAKPIAQTFGSLAPIQMRYRGGDGDPVRFIPCTEEESVSIADDAVEALLAEGWLPGQVALLTTGSRHPEQVERQRQWQEGQREQEAYWSSFWDSDQVFYGHVLGFKGLERPAVVLAVNGFGADGRGREKLYVGLSRARDRLVVCGDPDRIGEVGGEAVLKRLMSGEGG